MKNWKISLLALAGAALLSGSAFAQISYSEDFESYTLHPGGDVGSIGDLVD